MSANPFVRLRRDGQRREAVSCVARRWAVKRFSVRQCLDAMALDGVQPAVREAIQRRLRELDRMRREGT